MDEILHMIEQEKLVHQQDLQGDSDDERNIDEILSFIEGQKQNQQYLETVFESEYVLPEEAQADYEAIMMKEQQAQIQLQQDQQQDEEVMRSMNRLNLKAMSANAKPFVPKSFAP
jgi:uncharacterized membrane-anchored protein YjiN (DUF445 family)